MSPNLLADLLADTPYPGCVVTRPGAAVRLDFDGLILRYQRDGWHFGDAHLESTLSEHSAPEQVHPEIRRILKVVMTLKVERAMNEAEADGTTDPVAYLTNLAAEKMLAILDVAALANGRQAKIDDLRAERDAAVAHVEKMQRLCGKANDRLDELERDLAAKDKSLTTAHAALAQVSDLLGSPPPVVPDDAVEAVKMHLARRPQPAPAILTDALDAAGAPKVYHLDDDTERPIPDPERIRLLGERVHILRAQVREAADATNYLNALIEAHNALDDRHAPRLADGGVLSLAARIRSIPR